MVRRSLTHADPVVPLQHPRALLDTATEQGAARLDVLAGTGITEDMLSNPDARISYAQFGTLVANAVRLTGNTGLGLDYGQRMHLCHMGMLGWAVMSSDTVRSALERTIRFMHSLSPGWELSLREQDGDAILTARTVLSMSPFEAFATESLLVAIHAQARFLLRHNLPVRKVSVTYPSPPYAARYREVVDVPVVFDHDVTEVVFDAALLDEPMAWSDPATAAMAERACASESAVTEAGGLVQRVRNQLASRPGEYVDVDTIARVIGTSPRSLRRALRNMGTSYQEILDDVRRRHALEFLRIQRDSVEQIALRLGFSGVRSFRRAFKRWTGQTPAEFRSANVTALSAQSL